MPTILIVDDDPEVADVLRLGLEHVGFIVTICHHARRALDLLHTRHVDLVILDVRMPDMNGFTVLHELRTWEVRPRVMVLSGDGSRAEQQRALNAGASSYHLKPFRVQAVIAQVQALLQPAC